MSLIGKKRPKFTYKNLLIFQIWYILLCPLLISEIGFPRAVLYLVDGINVVLFLYTFCSKKQTGIKALYGLMLSIIVIGLLGLVYSGESVLLYLWGLRNTLRYVFFTINCVSLLRLEDILSIICKLDKLIYINLILGMYQYFVYHVYGDNLGALFGREVGANGYLIAYLCIIFTYNLARFIDKKVTFLSMLIRIAIILFLSIIAELKVMFIFVALCAVVIALVSKPSKKVVGIILITIGLMVLGLNFLRVMNPQSYGYFDSIETIIWYFNNGYNADGGVNRANGIAQIYDLFLAKDLMKMLVGLGLGQCDYSNIKAFSSSFYAQYGYLNYRFFFLVMTILEMGVLGILTYLIFWLNVAYQSYRECNYGSQWIKIMNYLNLIIIFIISIYNFALRSDPGYLWYLAITIPFIVKKDSIKNRILTGNSFE